MDSELKKIWGFHALFDCAACDIERVKSKANVRDFLAEMVREIDMVPFGAPYIERFATHDIDKSGISKEAAAPAPTTLNRVNKRCHNNCKQQERPKLDTLCHRS